MAFYKITLLLRSDGPPYQTLARSGIREFPSPDLDAVWHKLSHKCEEKWGRDLKSFDCVMISKRSPEYRAFIKSKEDQKDQSSFGGFPASTKKPPGLIGGSWEDSKADLDQSF